MSVPMPPLTEVGAQCIQGQQVRAHFKKFTALLQDALLQALRVQAEGLPIAPRNRDRISPQGMSGFDIPELTGT